MGEGTSSERDPANRATGLEHSQLGDDPPLAKVGHQAVEAAKLEIATEDGPDPFGLFLNHDDLAVLAGVSEWNYAADPETLALGSRDLVADALGGDFPLELGKRQQHIQGERSRGGAGSDVLG